MARRNVFLFVPNLIGYLRIILLIISSYYITSNHRFGLAIYLLSCSMDAVDGFAARLLNQSSTFGSMLDMITDRVSTMCLLMNLANLYTEYSQVFQTLLIIDIVSHWLHFFSAKLDDNQKSHKNFGVDIPLMRLYYQNKTVLTSICAFEQLFFASLLLYNFEKTLLFLSISIISLPGMLFKNWINILQIYNSCIVMANVKED